MNALLRLLSLAVLALTLAGAGGTARASTIDDFVKLVHEINDKAPPGVLPFSNDQIDQYVKVIDDCGSKDDVALCIDDAAKTDAALDNGVPPWLPKAFDIYFDVRDHDWWSLMADVGMEAACVAVDVLAGGEDVCGAALALVHAAQTVAADAQAAAKLLGALAGDVASVGKDVYCWAFGCDDSPPPTPPGQVAWEGWYFPRLSQGLAQRTTGRDVDWRNWAGKTPTDATASIVAQAPKSQFSTAGLMASLPEYWQGVYKLWDAKVLTGGGGGGGGGNGGLVHQVKSAADTWHLQSTANASLDHAQSAFDPAAYDWAQLSYKGAGLPDYMACDTALGNAGGAAVDDWVANLPQRGQGGVPAAPSNLGDLGNLGWPSGGYRTMCADFRQRFDQGIRDRLIVVGGTWVAKQCPMQHGFLQCASDATTSTCKGYEAAKAQAQGGTQVTCLPPASTPPTAGNPAAGKFATYLCPPNDKPTQLPILGNHPKGCHLPQVNQGPAPTPNDNR